MNTGDASDRRFVYSRIIDATPEQVFSAFSRPERLARWWGPEGFSSTFEAFDLRPGGTWRFVMHGPDGTHYSNSNVFKTVEPPSRVEVEHIAEDHHFVLSITFVSQGSQTLVGCPQCGTRVRPFGGTDIPDWTPHPCPKCGLRAPSPPY